MAGAVGCVLAGLCAGCSDHDSVSLQPVSGQVLYQGRPANGALVVFHDTRPREQLARLPIPRARTNPDGKFQVTSYVEGDGAPLGSYKVTVTLPTALPKDGEDPETGGNDADRLQGRYADPHTTSLTADIKNGNNELPPYELQ